MAIAQAYQALKTCFSLFESSLKLPLYKQNELTSDQIAKQLNISKPTLYKYLKHRNVKLGETLEKHGDVQKYAS